MSERFPSKYHDSRDGMVIEPNRRLLYDDAVATSGLAEYYNKNLNTRVIVMPKESEQAAVYRDLVTARLPVFSAIYQNDELLLIVPGGSRSFRRQLKFVARDIPNYGEIFTKLGKTLDVMWRAGLGLPGAGGNRSLLDNFAFSPDEQDRYGGNIYLVPPYELNPNITPEQELSWLRDELDNSAQFRPDEVQMLMDRVVRGWHEDGI